MRTWTWTWKKNSKQDEKNRDEECGGIIIATIIGCKLSPANQPHGKVNYF